MAVVTAYLILIWIPVGLAILFGIKHEHSKIVQERKRNHKILLQIWRYRR